MNAQLHQLDTTHCTTQPQLSLADVVEEVSKHAANSVEVALVIDRMLRTRKIRFTEHTDASQLTLSTDSTELSLTA